MAFMDRISVIIDVAADKAAASVKNFRTEIANADGVMGKAKAGIKSLGEGFKSAAANPAVLAGAATAAGTAIASFAIDAVHQFESVAKASLDLAGATGLSTEAASRWIAVGDDYQVSADQLASGIGKISKTLDDTKWEKYGIQTRDAAGHARDANEILIDSLSTLSRVSNETERARIGNELFGKGYANLVPLIGHTRKEYEDMLGAVDKGQVITDAEAAKAEKMRKAEDSLADALHAVTLEAGQMVAELAPVIESLAKVVDLADQLGLLKMGVPIMPDPGNVYDAIIANRKKADEATEDLDDTTKDFTKSLTTNAEGLTTVAGHQGVVGQTSMDLKKAIEGLDDSFDEAGVTADAFRSAIDKTLDPMMKLDEASDNWRNTSDDLTEKLKKNGVTLDENTDKGRANRDEIRKSIDAALDLAQAQVANGMSTDEAGKSVLAMRDNLIEQAKEAGFTQKQIEDYIEALGLTPETIETAIKLSGQEAAKQKLDALNVNLDSFANTKNGGAARKAYLEAINQGDWEKALEIIYAYNGLSSTSSKSMTLFAKLVANATPTGSGSSGGSSGGKDNKGSGGFLGKLIGKGKASGGHVEAGTSYPVGEDGVEIFTPDEDGTIIPNNALGGGTTYVDRRVFNMSMPPQTPESVAMAMQRFIRRNGPQS